MNKKKAEICRNHPWSPIGPIAKSLAKSLVEYKHGMHLNHETVASLGQSGLLRTGFKSLDCLTRGFKKTDLILIAGYVSMGQRELAHSIAANVALQGKISTAVFIIEHSKEFITKQFLASLSSVDKSILRDCAGPVKTFPAIKEAAGKLSKAGIYFCDEPKMSVDDIVCAAKDLKSKQDIGLIIIDDFQSISVREETPVEVMSGLKDLARSLRVPVMVVYQLRYPGPRKEKHHFLERRDLIGLARFSDHIFNITRAEYDNPTAENKGKAEILIENRDFCYGYAELNYVQDFSRFEEWPERAGLRSESVAL